MGNAFRASPDIVRTNGVSLHAKRKRYTGSATDAKINEKKGEGEREMGFGSNYRQ